jgi:hypothetical protein
MYSQVKKNFIKDQQSDLIIYIGKEFARKVSKYKFCKGFFINGNYIRAKYKWKIIKAEVEILDIEKIPMVVNIQTNFFGKLIFPTAIINSLIGLHSNRKKMCLVHGSGICKEKKGVLLIGSGSSGKTSIVIHSSKEQFYFLADDSIFVGKRKIYGFPRPISLEYYHKKILYFKIYYNKQIEFFLKRLLSFITREYITLLTDINLELFFKNRIEPSAELRAAIYLSKGNKFTFSELCDKNRVVEAIIKSTQSILWFSVQIGKCFASHFPESYLANYWNELKQNLRDFINEIPCYEVQTPTVITNDMYQQILQKINEILLGKEKIESKEWKNTEPRDTIKIRR